MAKKYRRKEPLAWGIILIAIGLIFLLANINLNVWDFIARLWPVILIAWGAWKLYFGIKESQEKSKTE
jgi:hypothetical protein